MPGGRAASRILRGDRGDPAGRRVENNHAIYIIGIAARLPTRISRWQPRIIFRFVGMKESL